MQKSPAYAQGWTFLVVPMSTWGAMPTGTLSMFYVGHRSSKISNLKVIAQDWPEQALRVQRELRVAS